MQENKLNKDLAQRARQLCICREWHDELLTLDNKHEMVEMYLRGIDFCLSNEFPTNDYIKQHFGSVAREHGIFVDDIFTMHKQLRKVVCLGTTRGRITLDDFDICEIFAKHTSQVEIYASNHSFAMVDVFDASIVKIHACDDAKICVNHYYGDSKIDFTTDGNAVVKIREKNKTTY